MVFRSIVAYLLRSEATRKAQQAVAEAAREKFAETQAAGAERAAEAAGPCDVGLVFALSIEAGGLLDRMDARVKTRGAGFVAYHGRLQQRRLVVVQSGPGRENAARATAALIAGHRPQWIISSGFAGGLVDDLAHGDLVIADSVASAAGQRLAIDVKLEAEPHRHVGRLLTVEQVVRTPEEKRALGKEHSALAVDMETFAVAEVCRAEKIRFMSVRTISDTADEQLPPDVEHLLHQKSLAGRLGAAAGSLARRPSSMKDLWKLREAAIAASDHLAEFLAEIIVQLAPPPNEQQTPDSSE